MVVEGVEQHSDVIVVEDIVALGDVGANLGRVVIAMKGDVEKFRVVTEKDFGRSRRRDVVPRRSLIKVLQLYCLLPDSVVQFAVDCGG